MKGTLILLLFSALVLAKSYTYEVYLFFFRVGEIKVELKEDGATAEGRTYEGWRWLYSYDFKFLQKGDRILLYEREKGKERRYEGKEVYEKKPWIPVVVEYLRSGKIPDNDLFTLKEEKNRVLVIPKKSKRLKKIELYGGRPPREIVIYGKVKLTLRLRDEREN